MTSNQPSSNKDNPSPSILRDTRQQKGISLEMVHEATKVPLDALKAIEQGYSVHRLPPFYYRGFIRIYAKYLNLEEAKVLQDYGIQDTAAPKVQPLPPKEPRPKSKLPPQPIEPQNHFVKDTLKPLLKRNLTGPRLAQLVKLAVLLVAVFFAFKIVGCMIHKSKTPPAPRKQTIQKTAEKKTVAPVEKAAKEKSKPKKEETPAKSEHPVEKAAVVSQVPESPAKALEVKVEAKAEKKAKRIELTVRATKSGWLQVKTDGQVVFQSTLKKGAAETWAAADSIELSGKNINLLEFELNGKLLGALGPSDRGAKRVVFTKDGLSVKK